MHIKIKNIHIFVLYLSIFVLAFYCIDLRIRNKNMQLRLYDSMISSYGIILSIDDFMIEYPIELNSYDSNYLRKHLVVLLDSLEFNINNEQLHKMNTNDVKNMFVETRQNALDRLGK